VNKLLLYNYAMSDFYALVPAAGFGARMGGELPKQYLPIAGRPMIAHALNTLCASPDISTVFVVLAPEDKMFHTYDWSRFGDKLQPLYCGGNRRSDTVLNGLIASELEPDEWVLVHDAARPCLTQAQLAKLIAELRDDAVGGILAVPVADTPIQTTASCAPRFANTCGRRKRRRCFVPACWRRRCSSPADLPTRHRRSRRLACSRDWWKVIPAISR
jgi:2-C-methyl-D-erythritol 4-phosphate cytidylyltransferase